MILVFPNILDFALEIDFNCTFLMGNEPCFATRKPEVGKFCLPSVNNLLLENTILIKN